MTRKRHIRRGRASRASARRSACRLGGLRQGHLHRHGGDDAFGAGRRGRRRPDRLHASGRHVRQAVPDAGFLPDLGPVPVGRDRPRLAHLSRPQGRALRLFLRAVGDDPVRLQGASPLPPRSAGTTSACCIWNPSSSRSARCGSSICCRSSSSSPRRRGECRRSRSGASRRCWRWRMSRPAGP